MDASAGSHPYAAAPPTPNSISSAAATPDGFNAAIPTPLTAIVKKRKASTTGSRGVANLTPEQLAKKRANDREAQRAIRERTKGQIETLERRIEELTSQQPYQELQHAIRQKELVEAENKDIKKKLASALSILQPLLGSYGELDSSSSYRAAPNLRLDCDSRTLSGPTSNPSIASLTPLEPPSLRSASRSSTYTPSPRVPQQVSPSTPFSSQSTPPSYALDRQRSSIAHGLDLRPSGEKLDLNFLLDAQRSTQQHALLPPHPSLPPPLSPPSAYSTPILNTPPTCPLDGLLLDFLSERQRRLAEGVPPLHLVGPAYPSVSSLLNPSRSTHAHPLSKVFTDIISTFPDLSTLPEQIAVLYVMFLVMRWQISPSPETYSRLPPWMAPLTSQLRTPHPAWIDHLPWPRMRDKMVCMYRSIPFDSWFIPYTTTLSVNWPYEATDTLLGMADSEELSINPVFERHVRELGNWSLGPAFAKAFPMLVETTRIKTEGGGGLVG